MRSRARSALAVMTADTTPSFERKAGSKPSTRRGIRFKTHDESAETPSITA